MSIVEVVKKTVETVEARGVSIQSVEVLHPGAPGEPDGGANDWTYYAAQWSTPPVRVGTIASGEVLAYVQGGVTRYRLVPEPYVAVDDAFYSSFTGGLLSGLLAARGG